MVQAIQNNLDAHRSIDDDRRRLGDRMRFYREEAGMTQVQLAQRIDKSGPTLSKIEAGQQSVSMELLGQIATALGVSTPRLLLEVQRARPSLPSYEVESLDILERLAKRLGRW